MVLGEIVAGQRQRWSLLEKISEGDVGEVFLVESLLERKAAILKRPYRGAFTSDLLRRTTQIRREAGLLKVLEEALEVSRFTTPLSTPALLDQSQSGSEAGERFFIIIEKAEGFNLTELARVAHFGQVEEVRKKTDRLEHDLFLERLAGRKEIPTLILLRALVGLVELFEQIHIAEFTVNNKQAFGVLWNDVKPEHVYWDPTSARLMVIDWGNGQLLENDGASQDRRFSRLDDYDQFFREMGKFLSDAHPMLYSQLEWPVDLPRADTIFACARNLKDRLPRFLDELISEMRDAQQSEMELLGLPAPEEQHLQQLQIVQNTILDFGETPQLNEVERLYARHAARLATHQDLDGLREAVDAASRLPVKSAQKWILLGRLADLAGQTTEKPRPSFLRALAAGTIDDWPTMLWELLAGVGKDELPDWWDEISQQTRYLHFGSEELPPYLAISRLYYSLKISIMRWEKGEEREGVLQVLEGEVFRKWKQVEPAPPNSGILYSDIEGIIDEIELLVPGTKESLEKALAQAKGHARIVMDAWGRKEFETARKGLRLLLLGDPHRRRVLNADQAMQQAPSFLLRVRQGASGEEAFQDFLVELELVARELRNQVGPAGWLDLILETFRQLRTGARPVDLMMRRPEILNEIPWLNEVRSRETISLPHKRVLTIERDPVEPRYGAGLTGVREGKLAPGGELFLVEPLDAWLPEARGSSARVFSGRAGGDGKETKTVAIKIMRPDQTQYALPLFREEAQILTILRDIPGMPALLECGFIWFNKGMKLPPEDQKFSGEELRGNVVRYGVDNVQNFLASLEDQVGRDGLPYLALPVRDHEYNLMAFCDANKTHGQFLPLRESLLLVLQICDILQIAHDRNIVYRDHKLLHYYWDFETQGVVTIDWNIAKRYPQGLGTTEKLFDLVQFGARALHHILAGRAAPGALPLGPNRPEEIEQAAHNYRVQWTYDDERLPNRIKEILENTLTEGYSLVKELKKDLFEVFQQLSEEPHHEAI